MKFALPLFAALLAFLNGCSYLDTVQRYEQSKENAQTGNRYDQLCPVADECMIAYGEVRLAEPLGRHAMAVLAVLQEENGSRVIDAKVTLRPEKIDEHTHRMLYGMFLPEGTYAFDIYEDLNEDGQIEPAERLARSDTVTLKIDTRPEHTSLRRLPDMKVRHGAATTDRPTYSLDAVNRFFNIDKGMTNDAVTQDVSLSDSRFSPEIGKLGMYDPYAFSVKTRYLYRLAPPEKDAIPLFFVHGAQGTPRDFAYLINHLDTKKFTPYVFYYPTGERLSNSAELLARWFLSDEFFGERPKIIIAHSMGGIVAREAINLRERYHPHSPLLFVSISTPYGGDEAAQSGVENAPYVIPSWRDIADKSAYIDTLFRHKMEGLEQFYLLFSYRNTKKLDCESSDGVIPLQSQLRPEAQEEAVHIRGFDETHTSILKSAEADAYLTKILDNFYDTLREDTSGK